MIIPGHLDISTGVSMLFVIEICYETGMSVFVVDYIYNFLLGQPKRHLLTTGWSLFVGSKRLRAGDSVLFIR